MNEELKSYGYYLENKDELRDLFLEIRLNNPKSMNSIAKILGMHTKTITKFSDNDGITFNYNIAKFYKFVKSNQRFID